MSRGRTTLPVCALSVERLVIRYSVVFAFGGTGTMTGIKMGCMILLGSLRIMAYLHCRRWTRIWIPNLMATLYYTETVHIAQTQTQITIPYFCVGQESESESVPESISGNVNEPLDLSWDT